MLTDLTGKLLIAMPGIGDSQFTRALILVCAHEPEYAMGIVLNKPIDDLTLPQLLSQLGIEQNIKVPEDAVLSPGRHRPRLRGPYRRFPLRRRHTRYQP